MCDDTGGHYPGQTEYSTDEPKGDKVRRGQTRSQIFSLIYVNKGQTGSDFPPKMYDIKNYLFFDPDWPMMDFIRLVEADPFSSVSASHSL